MSIEYIKYLVYGHCSSMLEFNDMKFVHIDSTNTYEARNAALKIASNEWITYVDAGHIMQSDFLSSVSNSIIKCPDAKNFYISKISEKFSMMRLYKQKFIKLESYIHHKSLINELGGFGKSCNNTSDDDFILKQCIKY